MEMEMDKAKLFFISCVIPRNLDDAALLYGYVITRVRSYWISQNQNEWMHEWTFYDEKKTFIRKWADQNVKLFCMQDDICKDGFFKKLSFFENCRLCQIDKKEYQFHQRRLKLKNKHKIYCAT